MAAAAITVLASASQAQTGTSTPLDVSNNSQARVSIVTVVDLGKDPDLSVWFDTGPTSTGPWTEINLIRMLGIDLPANGRYPYLLDRRVVLDLADKFIRARWQLRYTRNDDGTAKTFTMGITGTASVSA